MTTTTINRAARAAAVCSLLTLPFAVACDGEPTDDTNERHGEEDAEHDDDGGDDRGGVDDDGDDHDKDRDDDDKDRDDDDKDRDDDGGGTGGGTGGDDDKCDDGDGGGGELDIEVCLPSDDLGVTIDNPYFPMPVGRRLVLEGDEEGTQLRVVITVLDDLEEVAGVRTRVVKEAEYEDGELVEVSYNYFAQASDGTICYFGEAVNDYEDGQIVGHEGSWRADDDGNRPGILIPGDPIVGTMFRQEQAPGVAEDMSAIVAVDVPVSTPAGDFEQALQTIDWNPLEGETIDDGEDKFYAVGIGLVVDDVVQLVSWQDDAL